MAMIYGPETELLNGCLNFPNACIVCLVIFSGSHLVALIKSVGPLDIMKEQYSFVGSDWKLF